MRRLLLSAAALMLVLPAAAQVDAKLEKEIRASYNKVVAALKRKDVKAVMSQMTPNATMKEMGRTMTRAEFEQTLKQQIPMMDVQSAAVKFSKLSRKGDTANAEYTETMKAKLKTPDGRTALMEGVAKYRAVFKKAGSDWKMHFSETVGQPKMKVNGKPFNPGGGAPR